MARREGDEWKCWRCKAWNRTTHRHCIACASYRYEPFRVVAAVAVIVLLVWLIKS